MTVGLAALGLPVRPESTEATAHAAPDAGGRRLGRLAARSLWDELVLYPKPGLVSLRDSGAHDDMDATTLVRSLFALRPWFVALAQAGARGAPLRELRAAGIRAERAMLGATGGINTHRGAIFVLGLLTAAAGSLAARGSFPTDERLRATLAARWGAELAIDWRPPHGRSHGSIVAARYGASGARGEALRGFPSVFEIALPALREALAKGATAERAALAALFALLAAVDDTNVLHRGGREGLAFVRQGARVFARNGGALDARAQARALALHRAFSVRRLSPGGCADLLAAALYVHALQTGAP